MRANILLEKRNIDLRHRMLLQSISRDRDWISHPEAENGKRCPCSAESAQIRLLRDHAVKELICSQRCEVGHRTLVGRLKRYVLSIIGTLNKLKTKTVQISRLEDPLISLRSFTIMPPLHHSSSDQITPA